MVNYLEAGVISGFCVGEPWNTLAVYTAWAYLQQLSVTHMPFAIEALKLMNPLQPVGEAHAAENSPVTEEATQ